jgi:cellulose 1,4-beta-cellobiosidase
LEAETSALVGGGSQTGNLTRWGDYSSMSIDPVDDCTFWYTTEFLQNDGSFNWRTWITSFKFATCGGGVVTPPAAPTNLQATAGPSAGQISLSWTASAGATSYNVLRSTTSGSESLIASNVGATSYTDSGLAAGTYYYVVQAVNSGGTSPNSNEAFATATGVTKPPAPAGFTATSGPGAKKITLSWTAVSGATSYNVYRSTSAAGTYSNIASAVTATTYANIGLPNKTTFYYKITAVNGAGEGAFSDVKSATTK